MYKLRYPKQLFHQEWHAKPCRGPGRQRMSWSKYISAIRVYVSESR